MRRDSGTPTEYEKRLKALFSGDHYLRPALTVQAYFGDETTLTAFAVIPTETLWLKIAMGEYEKRHTNDYQDGQACFAVVRWSDCSKDCKVVTNATTKA